MILEHTAYPVIDPVAMAAWYGAHLGFRVLRATGAPTFTHFLVDSSGRGVLEIYNNPRVAVPVYAQQDPLLLHLGFATTDVATDLARLVTVGATVISPPQTTAAGDTLAMLRDPFGFSIQLCQRATPLLS